MISLMRGDGRLRLKALALGLGLWVLAGSSVMADGGFGILGRGKKDRKPPFQGFGLGYHLGYGYGGAALGVGPGGGHPLYGGPGYPHPGPCLQRCGGILPFPYYGGPGYPSPGHPNYFGGVGPLVTDRPVITVGNEPGEAGFAGDFGQFSGALPNPEAAFAPFSAAEAGESSGGASTPPPPSNPEDLDPTEGLDPPSASFPVPPSAGGRPARGRTLGIDAESTVDAGGVRGVKISRIYPGTAAEAAGLRDGDVIRSINGYRSEQPANLAWILAHAAPDNVLRMSVRTAGDGEVRTVTARLP